VQLTHTEKHSESHPRFSPDGKYLAFIASRGGEDDEKDPKSKAQVWLLNRAGGEAQRVTELPGGVSDFEWAPGGQRLVLVSGDPHPDEVEMDAAGGEGDESKVEKKSDTPKGCLRQQSTLLVTRRQVDRLYEQASERAAARPRSNVEHRHLPARSSEGSQGPKADRVGG
jgi:dipeptidyl aminopeptidase/acylaminoacyl peptidase